MRAPRFALAANVHDDTVTAGVQAKTQMARNYGVSAWRASVTRMSLSQSLGSTIPTLLDQGPRQSNWGKAHVGSNLGCARDRAPDGESRPIRALGGA
jgi:hypothetical protein